MSDDYLFDKQGTPDPEIQRLEQTLQTLRHQPRSLNLPPRQTRNQHKVRWFAAAALLLMTGAALYLLLGQSTPVAWQLAISGSATIDGQPHSGDTTLPVGQWLETDGHATATLQVADIGVMNISPQTRLSLQATGSTHRLRLDQGKVHAYVIAPPRILIVETPLADAVDLGCEYTLTVNDQGEASLQVLTGFVALETGQLDVFVPQGAQAYTSRKAGLGTPSFQDADIEFQLALQHFDHHPDDLENIQNLLDTARPRDTLSLWHMIAKAPPSRRITIYERILQLAPNSKPPDLTLQHVIDLNKTRLQTWRDALWMTW